MTLESSFTAPASPERAWALLTTAQFADNLRASLDGGADELPPQAEKGA